MPIISRFFGLVILMYFEDHNPPHFHVKYGEFEALIEIESGSILNGALPKTALRLVEDWRKIHIMELKANWIKLKALQSPQPIAPLE